MDLEQQRRLILSGQVYNDLTPELDAARQAAIEATNAYNASYGRPAAERAALLAQVVGHAGAGSFFEPVFRCEFGYNIHLGDNFYANFDCVLLDGGGITIGDNVLFGPRVGIYTTNHAVDPHERAQGACYARPVTIGDNVWVGGGVTITQGVTIGANSIIGAGAVVTRSIPADTIAVGVPARPIRTITRADRTGYRPQAR
ncbi:MAG: sugar O-acetyltransferase [Brooklawnia sp.]|uniref:sugar O-acetyltransferase n=1 Tax=Brooklawnia sp. TaxID=2699740 RepID=UPI003C77DE15